MCSSDLRGEAWALASELSEIAHEDFEAAVARGDAGSSPDVGRVPRGVLEPAVERVVFALPVGGVAGPLDTPRGLWVVRRVE